MPGLQVADLLDPLGEGGGDEAGARVAAGFFQFGQDVAHGRQAEAVRHESSARRSFSARVAHDRPDVAPAGCTIRRARS
jgi:hypothetical protein